jgi:hypothetical protein
MAVPNSPFYIVQNFISPKQCEMIVDNLGYYSPDVDKEGNPIKMMRHHEESEKIVYEKFAPLIPTLEKYYDFEHRGTESMTFEFHAEGVVPEAIADNSKWVKKKWTRTRDRDFSAVLFLSDYQEQLPFDSDYEVYGGKLEFLQHKFGFNPERGTLVVYPSSPHFINAISEIVAGDLFMARFYMAAQVPYQYLPENFPGNYLNWFSEL